MLSIVSGNSDLFNRDMITGLPWYVMPAFFATTAFVLYLLYRASNNSKTVLVLSVSWLLLQAVISIGGFYQYEKGFPPRLALLVLPPVFVIMLIFATRKGRNFADAFNIELLTLLQSFRFPVELVLYWLYAASYIPLLMTFEGRNWDIITGVTAPFIWLLCFVRKSGGRATLLSWNVAGLILLFSILINAALSVPTDFQKQAFDIPNTGVLYFPFVWLPGFLVPVALLSHLISVRQILAGKFQSSQM